VGEGGEVRGVCNEQEGPFDAAQRTIQIVGRKDVRRDVRWKVLPLAAGAGSGASVMCIGDVFLTGLPGRCQGTNTCRGYALNGSPPVPDIVRGAPVRKADNGDEQYQQVGRYRSKLPYRGPVVRKRHTHPQ